METAARRRRSTMKRLPDRRGRIDPISAQRRWSGYADPLQRISAGEEVGRVAALSDGIFAFAATMLGARLPLPRASRYPLGGRTAPRAYGLGAETSALAPEQPDARHFLAWPADAAQPARPFESRSRLAAFPFSRIRHRAAVLDQAPRPISSRTERLSSSIGSISSCSARASTPHGPTPNERSSSGRKRTAIFRARSSGASSSTRRSFDAIVRACVIVVQSNRDPWDRLLHHAHSARMSTANSAPQGCRSSFAAGFEERISAPLQPRTAVPHIVRRP